MALRSSGDGKAGREHLRRMCGGFRSITRQASVPSAILACFLSFVLPVSARAQGGTGNCPAGQVKCAGKCVDVTSDPKHCGSCTGHCGPNKTCVNGQCVATSPNAGGANSSGGAGNCPAGQVKCAGKCVDVTSDPAHCGNCNYRCGAGQSCMAGVCQVATPASGANSTGGAGNCPAGQVKCGNQCIDVTSDPSHCGNCNDRCASGQSCVSGVCQAM